MKNLGQLQVVAQPTLSGAVRKIEVQPNEAAIRGGGGCVLLEPQQGLLHIDGFTGSACRKAKAANQAGCIRSVRNIKGVCHGF